MKRYTRHLVFAGAAGLVLGFSLAASIYAQGKSRVVTPGITQNLLLRAPLAQFPGKQVTVFTADFERGAQTPLHRHPATELLYVLEGQGIMNIRGRTSRELRRGSFVLVEPDPGQGSFVHQAVNLSKADGMKTLVIVIHDEGTPPALPLKDPDL